jgi:hypothetical protein
MAVLGLNLQKAGLNVVSGVARTKHLKFSYNPSELSTSKSASWNRPTTASAASATKPQFAGVQPQSVSMEIFFDAYEDLLGDVSADVMTLFEWTRPTASSLGKNLPNPPILAFEWGSNKVLAGFQGYLSKVDAKYTMFRADGTPIRATATITLEEVPNDPAGQNPTSGSLNSRRSHVQRDRRSDAPRRRQLDPDPELDRGTPAARRGERWLKADRPCWPRSRSTAAHSTARSSRSSSRWSSTTTCCCRIPF